MNAVESEALTRSAQQLAEDFAKALAELPDAPSEEAVVALALAWTELLATFEGALNAYGAIPKLGIIGPGNVLLGDAGVRANLGVDLNGVRQVVSKLGPLWLATLTREFLAGAGRSDASLRAELRGVREDLAEVEQDAARLAGELEERGFSATREGR